MSRAIPFFPLFLVLSSFGFLEGRVGSQEPSLADVLTSVPNRANAILYADIPSIRTLTRGSMMHADFPDGMGEVRIAADLNLKPLQPAWEIGYVTFRNLKSAEYLASQSRDTSTRLAAKKLFGHDDSPTLCQWTTMFWELLGRRTASWSGGG